MGRGIFAAEDIKKGEHIIVEKPLLRADVHYSEQWDPYNGV